MTGRMLLNVRIGSVHFMSARRFPFVSTRDNPAHRVGTGEFRGKPGWRPFAVYRFFGMVR